MKLPAQMIERYRRYLQINHVSDTTQRTLVLQAFEYQRAASKPELAQRLDGFVDKTTVYRTIKLFIKIGIIKEVSGNRFELSDLFIQHHHMRICRACGKRIGFLDTGLEKALARFQAKIKFHIEAHEITLTGLCVACQKGSSDRRASDIGNQLRRRPAKVI